MMLSSLELKGYKRFSYNYVVLFPLREGQLELFLQTLHVVAQSRNLSSQILLTIARRVFPGHVLP